MEKTITHCNLLYEIIKNGTVLTFPKSFIHIDKFLENLRSTMVSVSAQQGWVSLWKAGCNEHGNYEGVICSAVFLMSGWIKNLNFVLNHVAKILFGTFTPVHAAPHNYNTNPSLSMFGANAFWMRLPSTGITFTDRVTVTNAANSCNTITCGFCTDKHWR
jgi:hypothetical protein